MTSRWRCLAREPLGRADAAFGRAPCALRDGIAQIAELCLAAQKDEPLLLAQARLGEPVGNRLDLLAQGGLIEDALHPFSLGAPCWSDSRGCLPLALLALAFENEGIPVRSLQTGGSIG